jgi:hypothetical protein
MSGQGVHGGSQGEEWARRAERALRSSLTSLRAAFKPAEPNTVFSERVKQILVFGSAPILVTLPRGIEAEIDFPGRYDVKIAWRDLAVASADLHVRSVEPVWTGAVEDVVLKFQIEGEAGSTQQGAQYDFPLRGDLSLTDNFSVLADFVRLQASDAPRRHLPQIDLRWATRPSRDESV